MTQQTAVQRLRLLVSWVSDHRDDHDRCAEAWVRYLRHVPNDAASLRGPEVDSLLLQLRELGEGWPTRVVGLTRTLREAKQKSPFRVVRPDEEPDADGPESDVFGLLDVAKSEGVRRTLRNATLILQHDTRWQGRIRRNDFAADVEVDGASLADETTTGVAIWLDRTYGLILPTSVIDEAIRYVARQSSYHPVREYLRGLTWDRRPRAKALLGEYLGAAETRLHERLSLCFLVSCVARVMDPGCQVDTVLVLQGPQGEGKSQAIRTLGGQWYSDTEIDPHGKDAYGQIQGVWLYEVGEIEKWNGRRDQATIKAFISSREDRYRPPYGRNTIKQPRQCVIVGSTNKPTFLADETGSRRWWPVKVAQHMAIDLTGLVTDRDQIWAEAVAMYDCGDRWHLDSTEAAELAEVSVDFADRDPWYERIADYCADACGQPFAMHDLLRCLGVDGDRQSAGAGNRAGAVLRQLGGTTRRITEAGVKRQVWTVPRT